PVQDVAVHEVAAVPPVAAQPAVAFLRASICEQSAATCEFANCSDALACCDVLVTSDWIRPNTRRWRSVVGAGNASAAASAAQASASISIISARRFSSAVPASKLLFLGWFDTLTWVLRCGSDIVAP